MATNETERRRWSDQLMVANWHKRERFTDSVTPGLLAAVAPKAGERILDIGCGGGKSALAAAAAVGARGAVVGADISPGMVALASSRAATAKAANASFRVTDVQAEAVPGAPFDAAMSQFGVMFFEDPLAAFTNIRKQLKRSGRLAFACWQPAAKNQWFFGPVLAPFAPPPPPPVAGKSATGPFALADARRTRALLNAAGFTHIQRAPKRLVRRLSDDTLADEAQLRMAGVPEAKMAEATVAMNRHLQRFRQADGLARFELHFQIFTALNP